MQRIEAETLHDKVVKIISDSHFSMVYLLKDGRYFKMFNPNFINLLKLNNCDIEKKILEAKIIDKVPEIIIPDSIVYGNNYFLGYTMPSALGIDSNEYDRQKSLAERMNLYKYAEEHFELEKVIKRANKEEIVFPDLLTCDNIFINNGKYQFIDYDGIQIGNNRVLEISTSLGDDRQYRSLKYMNKNQLYTINLDKKSLILLYYLTVFNIDLNHIGKTFNSDGNIITLDEILNLIGMDDYDFAQATYLAIYDKINDNVYLDDLVYRIADKYELRILDITPNGDIKRLIKK